jgi:hypothetical protein
MKDKRRYGQFSGIYGAIAALIAYALVQAGVVPESDVPFLVEAGSAVIGAFGGLIHARITDTDGIQQRDDQK